MKLENNASDFFALTANAAQVLKTNYREKVRFLRGYVQNIGFNRTTIEYEARAVAGESKYSIRKLFKFSINTILCFSDLPLKLGIYSGIIVGFLGLLVMLETIYEWAVKGTPNGYRDDRSAFVLYVRDAVRDCGNYRGVYRDPVYRIEGSSNLYRS